MKNRAVELLFSTQFNILDITIADITNTASDDEFYEFCIKWYDFDTGMWKSSYRKLPHLTMKETKSV